MIPSQSDLIKVNRYELSRTWWNLLQKLSARDPTHLDNFLIATAYNKIVEAMKKKSDSELMQDMIDIIDAVDFARLSVGIRYEGYYKK